MRKIAVVTALLFATLAAPASFAQSFAEKYFKNGNKAYLAGDYNTAIKLYRLAEVENEHLYYNLANAYFNNGKIGKAILYYNRALKILPRDEDIRFNLKKAREARKEKLEPEKTGIIFSTISAPYRLLSMNEQAVVNAVLFSFFILLIFIRINLKYFSRSKKTANIIRAVSILLGSLFIIQSTTSMAKFYNEEIKAAAVITKESVTVRSGPSAGSKKVFLIHDGAEVTVGANKNGFSEIALPTGWAGWVPSVSIEII